MPSSRKATGKAGNRRERTVAFGNGTFVVVGEGGTILQSDPLLALDLVGRPEVRLSVTAPVDRSCRIEYADALAATNVWQTLTTVVLTDPSVTCPDVTAAHAARRFYRAVLVP